MKRNRIQGISAAVASLALAGTCFAAPAYAASNSVFGSGFSGQSSTETPITSPIAEPVPDTSQATMPDDPDDVDPDFLVDSDVDYAALAMEMLGLDDAALDQILSGDLSIVTNALGDTIDADTQAAIDEASQSLAEANLTTAQVKEAFNAVANEAVNSLADLIDATETFLTENNLIVEDAVLYSGEPYLADDPTAQQLTLGGASMLIPGNFAFQQLTPEEIAAAFELDNAEDIVSDAYIATNDTSSAGLICAQLTPDALGGAGYDIAQTMADESKLVYLETESSVFSAGCASLEDGTPIFDLGYLKASEERPCFYELIMMPSDDGGLVVVFALTDETATLDDCATLSDIMTSLAGTGYVEAR